MCHLTDAVQLLEEVHADNEQIKGNAEQLSRWYLELFDAFSMLKEQYVRLQKERDSVEHQYQQLCDGWRLELEQKQAAFDHARACIMSQRDVEVLRNTIRQDAERPLRAECAKLRKDASDARTQFVNLRREVEAEKSAASAKILHLETAVKQLQTQNDAHVAHAKQLASSSGLSEIDICKQREARLVTECDDLRKQVLRLTKEADEMRAENVAMECQQHSCTMESGHKIRHLEIAQLQAQHETAVLQEKSKVMQEEMKQYKRSNEQLVQELQDSYHKIGTLRKSLEVANAEVFRSVETLEDNIHTVHTLLEAQIAGCCAQLEVLQDDCKTKISCIEGKIEAVEALIVAATTLDSKAGTMQLYCGQRDTKVEKKPSTTSVACSPMPGLLTDENSPPCSSKHCQSGSDHKPDVTSGLMVCRRTPATAYGFPDGILIAQHLCKLVNQSSKPDTHDTKLDPPHLLVPPLELYDVSERREVEQRWDAIKDQLATLHQRQSAYLSQQN